MFKYLIYCYGNQILSLILCVIFGCIGHAANKIYKEHINDDRKRAIAKVVVQFVEQVWYSLDGPGKLQQALVTAREMLEKKDIEFDPAEMEVLIEAAVAEFNDAFRKPLKSENAAAVYQVPVEK